MTLHPAPESRQILRYLAVALFLIASIPAIIFTYSYIRYGRQIDAQLRKGVFSGTSDIYAASPRRLITNVSGQNRERRTIVRYEDIPQVLVNAVISAEDKRFFHHRGFDPLRMMKAAYVDVKDGHKNQGASTLSMQLARSLWLDPAKNWTRKAAQLAMALRLEETLTKEQIFTYYCNQVYLGRRGTYSLHGFGAAAGAYFGKDIRDLTLPEAATLAGLIQRPSYYHPLGNLDRMRERRNLVLALMQQNGYITPEQQRTAMQGRVTIAPASAESAGAPYFVDLVGEELPRLLGERDAQGAAQQVYTTLDLDLQRAAEEAVRAGMPQVGSLLRKKTSAKSTPPPHPQVALVAIDPHTGEVRALVGGRNYVSSQLNHALAERQPGSVFKPFVYAAALNTAVAPAHQQQITTATMLMDEPTVFWSGGDAYTPSNFGHSSTGGEVTVRQALRKSLNIPTVNVAEMTGYRAVANLARQAGLGDRIQPTPSIALGSYEASPLDIAGAYTIFANHGLYVRPSLISEVRTKSGVVSYRHEMESHQVLDPRVAYLMVNLMEDVVNSGTGAGVRTRGFRAPAAGKTGTSRDGWFAGFTSQLLCVVWIGIDDNSDLNLEGSKAALPIWTEFMKAASQMSVYRDTKPFKPPPGITSASIDPDTGLLASTECPETRNEFFIAGSEPQDVCNEHAGSPVGP